MFKKLCFLATTLAVLCANAAPAVADTQDFTIESFEANYLITRDSRSNASELYVREGITAIFPDFDQNHGILRAIPRTYRGHSVELVVDRITAKDGSSLPYETYSENDNLVLKIGDANTYVHGRQEYFIYYHMRGVTLNFDDHDEFYWDINGDQWRQPFGKVTARVHVDDSARGNVPPSAMLPHPVCYTGVVGSTANNCRVQPDNNGVSFTTTKPLAPGETLTVVMGFSKGTFAPYTPGPALIMQGVLKAAGIALPPVLALWLVIRNWRRYGRDPRGRGTIVPNYIPPKGVTVLQSSVVLKEGLDTKFISAAIIDLAVRHYLKIYEVKDRPTAKKPDDYEVELIKAGGGLSSDEHEVVRLLFGHGASPGDRIVLKDLSSQLALKVKNLGDGLSDSLTAKGYFRTPPYKAKRPYIVAGITLIAIGFIGFPVLIGVGVAGLIVLVSSVTMPARTLKGVELRDYMQLAEADRLKVLQSPHGELTEKVNIDDKHQLVKLYERLLPYAMVFGIEKDWAKQFEHLYTEEPGWYHGSGTFHAAYFASSIGSFGAASTAAFAPASSSSSSGFSGGSSGGGGGGGGGGGW